MQCRFCDQELKRKSWCDECMKPQLDLSQVVWTDRTCRKCYSTGPFVLGDSPFCTDCRNLIIALEQSTNTKEENIVKKEVRWLQAWLLADDITSHSALISWFAPEFINDESMQVDKYYLYTIDGSIKEFVDGDTRQIILTSLESGKDYELNLAALIDEKLIKKSLKKKFKTMSI
jgi:hypothetical protein